MSLIPDIYKNALFFKGWIVTSLVKRMGRYLCVGGVKNKELEIFQWFNDFSILVK